MKDDVPEILTGLQKRLDKLFLEPCSPVELEIINAMQVLVSVVSIVTKMDRRGRDLSLL